MTTTTPPSAGSAAGACSRGALAVLSSAREARLRADAAEVQLLVDAVDWAVANPPVFGRDAASWEIPRRAGEAPEREPLSAEGVPEVDKAAVAELGMALGVSTQGAQALVGDALELAYRLPALWTRVLAGEVKAWRARRVAQATRCLSRVAAGYVDKQLAPVAHRVGTGAVLDRLVSAAMTRFDAEQARLVEAQRAEQRGFEVLLEQTTLGGLTPVTGQLDLPDALDVEAAVAHAAQQLAAWGSTDALGVRRARALGDLARQHLAWSEQDCPSGAGVVAVETGEQRGAGQGAAISVLEDLGLDSQLGLGGVGSDDGGSGCGAAFGSGPAGAGSAGTGGDRQRQWPPAPDQIGGPIRRVPPRRQIVLYAHLTDAAIWDALRNLTSGSGDGSETASGSGQSSAGRVGGVQLGRVENTGTPVTVETIRSWCGDPHTSVSVRPVIDLTANLQADTYEVPERLREQIRLRDGICCFPGCTAPGLICQDDHVNRYDRRHPERGGRTESRNLRLLCQRHHNLKTHYGFTYAVLASGAVLWRTPRGLTVRVDRDGSLEYTAPGADEPDRDPPEP